MDRLSSSARDRAPRSPAQDSATTAAPVAETAEQILRRAYAELRRLAAAKMRGEPPGQTLQPTALVHEAWLRLGADKDRVWRDRAQFFAAAAEAMRRILIENARRKHRIRHGGRLQKVSAEGAGAELVADVPDEQLLQVDEAIDALAAHDARCAEIVKQWYFVGLSVDEIAEVLDVSATTVKRDLAYGRTWLHHEITRIRC